jgi:cobalt-precorrin-5B (C1)-methyltransferase
MSTQLYDLAAPAQNGLRRGITTGTCATAAVKAALARLLYGESPEAVPVTLADGEHFVDVPVKNIVQQDAGWMRAEVVKDAGDDPDQTHRATIFARVRRNGAGEVRFHNGTGVGIVTQPGLQIPVGEPAINPVPRKMMLQAVREVLEECGDARDMGFDLEIGCENGGEIAKRTFNPRLGVVGGISILGTTGIVEPKSMASFKASIEVYIRVALGDRPQEIVLAPGNLGQRFARSFLDLPIKQCVQVSNFAGFALDCVRRTLEENDFTLPRFWFVGHPGKLAKMLDGAWDTHSGAGGDAVGAVCRVASEMRLSESLITRMRASKTVEGIIEILEPENMARGFWGETERRIALVLQTKLARVSDVRVRLFKMDGTALGGEA